MTKTHHQLKETIHELKTTGDRTRLRDVLGYITGELPKSIESLELFELGFDLIETVNDPASRCEILFEFVKGVPLLGPFIPVYMRAVESAIVAADVLPDHHHRTTELLRIAKELPTTEEFEGLRIYAWRLALGLPDKPRFHHPSLKALAKELPKTLDYSFYQSYTLLGIAKQMPKKGLFLDLYRDAIDLAMEAAAVIEEPYYRKYALVYIAREVSEREELFDYFKRALEEAYSAALEIKDPFAKEHALVDIIHETPKVPRLYEFLIKVLEKTLTFFTVRSRMEDLEVLDVVDYILSAEELGLNESKKKRFSREKYAKRLSRVFEEHGSELRDIRFINILRPYTHVWIQPRELREAIKNTVDKLEALRKTYHGGEIERPVFIKESPRAGTGRRDEAGKKKETSDRECIAIDLGATNTVVIRKKDGERPEFVTMESISRKYDNTFLIPTLLSRETNTIGTEVVDPEPVTNIKQMLLDGNPGAGPAMERFLKVLYGQIRKTVVSKGWFSLLAKKPTETIYVTVPIGFTGYRDALKGIAGKVFKGVNVEFIEEPLAAAIGYQVASKKDRVFMIVDFGGCTLDCMILRLNVKEVHVIAKPERAQILGGHDIDVWLAGHLASKAGLDPDNIPYNLLKKAEELKIGLTYQEEVPFQWKDQEVGKISRYELEEVLEGHEFYRFVDRTISYVIRKAEKVGLKRDRIEAVILTGGSSQIPSFKDKIGQIFPELRSGNRIFDHSPLTAVCEGAALFGTRDVVDRHLGMAYAIRHVTGSKEPLFSYTIIMEKGEALPFEKTFRITPAGKLGLQDKIFVEIFEVPDHLLTRRWVTEDGVEFLKQEISETKDISLKCLDTIAMTIENPPKDDISLSVIVDEWGYLYLKQGAEESPQDTGIRLQ